MTQQFVDVKEGLDMESEFDAEVATERKAPHITEGDLEKSIISEEYHRFPNTTVTVCCLVLANGFTVIGESACVSPENFDRDLGIRLARADAKRKIWQLEGYALKDRLYRDTL